MTMLYTKLYSDFEHMDDRGKLVQLVHDGYRQINVLETKKGVTRGGHYHKICHEAFYVIIGSVKVMLKKEDNTEEVLFAQNDFFMIDPGVVHSMYFPEDCLMVQMYDIPVELGNGKKDIYLE